MKQAEQREITAKEHVENIKKIILDGGSSDSKSDNISNETTVSLNNDEILIKNDKNGNRDDSGRTDESARINENSELEIINGKNLEKDSEVQPILKRKWMLISKLLKKNINQA